jgi:two-component system phosphate regulon sensor histidine kinase PhoR
MMRTSPYEQEPLEQQAQPPSTPSCGQEAAVTSREREPLALEGETRLPQPAASDPQRMAEVLANIQTVSAALVGTLSLEKILHGLMARVVQVLPGVEAGLLWLYDRRSGKLRMASFHGLSLDPSLLGALQTCQIVPGEGVAGQAFQANDLVSVVGQTGYHTMVSYTSAQNKALFQKIGEQIPHALLVFCLPLQREGEIVGVMELMHFLPQPAPANPEQPEQPEKEKQPPDEPVVLNTMSPFCLQVLHTFANTIAAAIRSAQIYEESQKNCQRLSAFDAVVTAISTATDLQDLMGNVLDVVLNLLPVSSGIILLLDPSTSTLRAGAAHGLPGDYVRSLSAVPVAGAACEEVFTYGQPTLRPLIEERGEAALLDLGLESCAYLPLLAGGTVVGVLGLFGDGLLPRSLDLTSLMPLSNQVGFAIANVRLYEASQLERNKLNTVINSIAEGVFFCDSKGRLVLANEAAMELLSLDSVPFEQPLSEMTEFYGIRDLSGEPMALEKLPMVRALSGEVFHDYRLLLRGASGNNSVMSFSGAPTPSNGGEIEGAVVIFRDITANQRLERAKDDFLAVTAHELRSPLASVRSYADMLLSRKWQNSESDPRDVRGLSILSQQVTHMLRMVDNLLDVSKLDAGRIELQLQQVNLVFLANQVLDQRRPEAGSRELLLESGQPEIIVQCDQLRIRQVLTNLVGNAIKYSPPESSIKVYLRVVERGGPEGKTETGPLIAPAPTRREVLVSVANSGPLITPEQQARLFQRFYRASGRRRAEGLGLGLYLSREFVLMHQGEIWVESVEGIGNSFSFTLPINTPSSGLDGSPEQVG